MRQGAQDYVLKDELSPEMLVPIVLGIRERLNLRGEVIGFANGCRAPSVRRRWLARPPRWSGYGASLVVSPRPTAQSHPRRDGDRQGDRGARPARDELPSRRAFPGPQLLGLAGGPHRVAHLRSRARRFHRCRSPHARSTRVGRRRHPLARRDRRDARRAAGEALAGARRSQVPPLGAEVELPVRARILAATHVPTSSAVSKRGAFAKTSSTGSTWSPSRSPRSPSEAATWPSYSLAFARRAAAQIRFSDEAITWLSRRPLAGQRARARNVVERIGLLSESELIDVSISKSSSRHVTAGDSLGGNRSHRAGAARSAHASWLEARGPRARHLEARDRSLGWKQERSCAAHRSRSQGARSQVGARERRAACRLAIDDRSRH